VTWLTDRLQHVERIAARQVEGIRDARAGEIVQTVRVLDRFHRHRFMNDTEALAAWERASSFAGWSRPGAEPSPGSAPSSGSEARPAA
jgi:hypothetical protein